MSAASTDEPNLSSSPQTVVELRGLNKAFDGVRVAHEISLSLVAGQVVGLIGPNGAGKTSMFNLITGQVRADSGHVIVAGQDVTSSPVHARAALGLSRTWQNIRLFPTLTVLDNLLVAARQFPGGSLINIGFRPSMVRRHMESSVQQALKLLEDVELVEEADTLAADLPFGQQKLVSIARALMNSADCLLLDEPMSGIDQGTYDKIRQLVRSIAAKGSAVCVVEHNVGFVRDLCDEAHFMANGEIIASGSVEYLMQRSDLTELYFGTGLGA